MSLSHTSKLNGCRELFAAACSDFAVACLVFLIAYGLATNPWLLFSCAGVLWPDLSCMQSFPRSTLPVQATAAAWSQNQNFFLPFLPNGRSYLSETRWACSYHHYASPIEKSWSMDARISRKMENGWRFQRSISQKPCIGIGWNSLGRLLSPTRISPWNRF